MEAYASPPWGEILDYAETREYLAHMHEHEDGFVKTFSQGPDEPPYLYVHGINYKDDVDALIDEELTGGDAYYTARNRDQIASALEGCGSVTYISNVHAAKDVEIPDYKKPRLKVFPRLIDALFTENQSDTIVLYTHRETSIFRTAMELDSDKFQVRSVAYDIATKPSTPQNENHRVDYLELVIIKRAPHDSAASH
jgi:hypothetical protein